MTELEKLIILFLQINPSPSDAQMHSLAAAIAVDKEELEARIYEMLGETETVQDQEIDASGGDAPGDHGPSESQQVLDGDYDPSTTDSDDLALNDGAPEGYGAEVENQDSLLNDGVGPEDTGVDVAGDQEVLINDGAAPTRLRASQRLRAKH